jgi:16S rRNA G966 N2-methylase RsmD
VEELAISIFVGSNELDDNAVKHLNNVVEDLTIGLDMKIMEIDSTSTNHLPDSIILLVFLDP